MTFVKADTYTKINKVYILICVCVVGNDNTGRYVKHEEILQKPGQAKRNWLTH